MDILTYRKFKVELEPYITLRQGILGYHKKTQTPLIVTSIETYQNRLDYRCKICQIENHEQNLCDVIYSEAEVDLTDITLQEFVEVYRKLVGKQLTLF